MCLLLSFGAKWIMMLTLMINICLLSVKVTLNGYDVLREGVAQLPLPSCQ